jgi:hypothetical protein
MTTKTLTSLVITAVLAGSAVAGLQATDPAVDSGLSARPVKTEADPYGEGLFFVLPLAPDRLTASCSGLKLTPPPIVCLTP